jgi:hypothetical protein
MAKNKHEKLAAQMQCMLNRIDEQLSKCSEILKEFQIISLRERRRLISAPPSASLKTWPVITYHSIIEANASTFIDVELARHKSLLYCPDSSEISNSIDWYEKDNEANSLTLQICSIGEYYHQKKIIKNNLLKNPIPFYEQAIREWKEDPNSLDVVAKNPKKLEEISFAPRDGESVAQAYERLRNSTRARESRHKQNLRAGS